VLQFQSSAACSQGYAARLVQAAAQALFNDVKKMRIPRIL